MGPQSTREKEAATALFLSLFILLKKKKKLCHMVGREIHMYAYIYVYVLCIYIYSYR